jgi:hypothetical protein
VRAGFSVPTRGTNGQNSQRPNSTRAAGSTHTAKTRAVVTPSAPAMPSVRLLVRSAAVKVSRPSVTVPALATMAGAAERSARRIAACRSSSRRSSSR